MAIIKIMGFTGEAPRVTPRLLGDTAAQIASSVRLEDGELSPFRKPYQVADHSDTVIDTIKTIYNYQGEWLYWYDEVNPAPGPVAQDRLYYTGDGAPKMRIGPDIFDLAVPAPTAALVATPVGVTGALYETRIYAYTFVTDYGEESEPCELSNEVNVSPGQVVTLSGFQAAPAGRAITKQRIYRSQTGKTGTTKLYFIAERAASNVNYSDSIGLAEFNEPLPSNDWNPPPNDLKGLISLPNGIMAAFVGKDLYFSEPYRPHAWPEKYVLTTDYDIVALAAIGTSVAVGTTGNPYIVSGTAPETMVMEKMELNMPCLSARGMVDLGYAAAYPSHDGLVLFQNGNASVASGALFTRDQWLRMDPATMVAGQFYGRYFASFEYADTDGTLQAGTLIIDLTGDSPFLIRSPHKADAMRYDLTDGALYLAIGAGVFEFDSQQSGPDIYTWKSKLFIMRSPTSFGAIQFEADQPDDGGVGAAAENAEQEAIREANEAAMLAGDLFGEINGAAINEYASNGDALREFVFQGLTVNIYADGKFLWSVSEPGKTLRIPAKKSRQWEVEVVGTTNVQEITLASTGQELKGA